MLRVNSISFVQFKNYKNSSFHFEEKVVGICGKNGIGKTNLLDAIHYLCFTKSYFSRQDTVNVQQGTQGFRIEGSLTLNDATEKVVCILRETGKKEFLLNDEPYIKFSQHIGRYPCVLIAPDDIQLIIGNSDERRRFIDTILSQLSVEYLQQLITYNKILQQRNSLLKSFAESGTTDFSLLDVLDEQMIKPGDYVALKRKEFMVSFLPQVKQLYNDIARKYEDVTLVFESELLSTPLRQLLSQNRQKDILAMRTMSGLHRDDLDIQMGVLPFKTIASQGQRKSLLFALKLAEMEVLKNEKGFAPLLLLDDVFEKLDEDRITNLLQRVCVENEGQVFITDTNKERLLQHLEPLQVPHQVLMLG
jgi:DNA replication and repair protein RecF